MSSMTLFFEELKLPKNWLLLMSGWASFHGPASRRPSGRAIDSTLTTVAPLSARYLVAIGPTPNQVKSRIDTPCIANGPTGPPQCRLSLDALIMSRPSI